MEVQGEVGGGGGGGGGEEGGEKEKEEEEMSSEQLLEKLRRLEVSEGEMSSFFSLEM